MWLPIPLFWLLIPRVIANHVWLQWLLIPWVVVRTTHGKKCVFFSLIPIDRLYIAARDIESCECDFTLPPIGWSFSERQIVALCCWGRGGKMLKVKKNSNFSWVVARIFRKMKNVNNKRRHNVCLYATSIFWQHFGFIVYHLFPPLSFSNIIQHNILLPIYKF